MTLTADEREQIDRHVRDAFGGAGPEAPADHLARLAAEFATQANSEGRPTGPVTPGQVLACGYNVLESLQTEAASEAQEALWDLAGAAIRDAVWWIGSRVLGLEGSSLQRWAEDEESGQVTALRVLLWVTLVRGRCDCQRSARNLSLQDDPDGPHPREHDLALWDGTQSLGMFLFEELVSGALRLASAGGSERAMVNGVRHGMLAKVILDGALRAGYVLRCREGGCRGEVNGNDHCGVCGHLARVEDPSFWLWSEGDRRPSICRRCSKGRHGCGYLYFRHRGACHCGASSWSRSDTQVWVPVARFSLDQGSPGTGAHVREPQDHGPSPADNIFWQEAAEQLPVFIQAVENQQQREILHRLLVAREEPETVAAWLGVGAQSRRFLRLCREALGLIPPDILEAAQQQCPGLTPGGGDHA